MKKLILTMFFLILNVNASNIENNEISNSYISENWTIPTSCAISCQDVKEGYFTRIKNFDLKSGGIECFVYAKNDHINAVSTISYTNPKCAEMFKKDEFAKEPVITGADNIERYDNVYGSRDSVGNGFINAPKFLISSLTLDSQIVNINNSLLHNQVKLQNGYTTYSNSQDTTSFFQEIGNSIKSMFGVTESQIDSLKNLTIVSSTSELLGNSVMFVMHFLSENNEILVKMKSFLLFTILPVLLMTVTAQKASKKFQKISDGEDIIEKIGVGVLILVIFFLSSVRIPTDKDEHISQTIFHNLSRSMLYQGAQFADRVSHNTTVAYLKSNAKEVGIQTASEVQELKAQKSQLEKIQPQMKGILQHCHDKYDVNKLKEFTKNNFGINSNFPPNEIVKYEDMTLGSRTQNYYQFLKKQSDINAQIMSVSACYNAEMQFLRNKKELENINVMLNIYNNNRFNYTLNNQVDILTKIMLRNSQELGFLNAPLIATTSIALDSIGVFPKNAQNAKDSTQNVLKAYRDSQGYQVGDIAENEGFIDSTINSAIGNVPYLMLPFADSINSKIATIIKNDESDKSSSIIGSIIEKVGIVIPQGKILAMVNYVKDAIDNARSSDLVVTIVSSIVTIIIMMYIVLYLPIIAIAMASFAVLFFYFLNVEIFYIASPFVVAFAFVSNQLEILKSIFKTLLILAFKPVLIVISIVLALFAFEFFTILNQSLLEQQFEPIFAMTEAMQINSIGNMATYLTADFGLIFIKGFISMGISIVTIFVCFYLVLNGANLILEMFGIKEMSFDSQNIIGDRIDSKSSKVNTPVV